MPFQGGKATKELVFALGFKGRAEPVAGAEGSDRKADYSLIGSHF
jgi:hypothetical protein